MPIVKATARQSSMDPTIAVLVIFALISVAAVEGLHAFGRWTADLDIKHHEDTVRATPEADESTVVLVDKVGVGWVYYKLGHGPYANALRRAGIGCRVYRGGAAYTFEKYKTSDSIPFDTFQSGATIVGNCDVSNFSDSFDLVRAQK